MTISRNAACAFAAFAFSRCIPVSASLLRPDAEYHADFSGDYDRLALGAANFLAVSVFACRVFIGRSPLRRSDQGNTCRSIAGKLIGHLPRSGIFEHSGKPMVWSRSISTHRRVISREKMLNGLLWPVAEIGLKIDHAPMAFHGAKRPLAIEKSPRLGQPKTTLCHRRRRRAGRKSRDVLRQTLPAYKRKNRILHLVDVREFILQHMGNVYVMPQAGEGRTDYGLPYNAARVNRLRR